MLIMHHHLHTIMRQTLQRAEAVGVFALVHSGMGDCHTGYAFASQTGWLEQALPLSQFFGEAGSF